MNAGLVAAISATTLFVDSIAAFAASSSKRDGSERFGGKTSKETLGRPLERISVILIS